VCWQNCPGGFRDDGAFCAKPGPYGRGAGYALWDEGKCRRQNGACEKSGLIWYPKCRAGFHPVGCCVCSPDCVNGMKDIGVSCAKGSYGRGVGEALKSAQDLLAAFNNPVTTIAGCAIYLNPIRAVQETIPCLFKKLDGFAKKVAKVVSEGVSDLFGTGCKLNVGNLAGTVKCLFGKAKEQAELLFGKLGPALLQVFKEVKDLLGCVIRQGALQIGSAVSSLVRDPIAFFRQTFGDLWSSAKDASRGLLEGGSLLLAGLEEVFTSGNVPDATYAKLFDWAWGQAKALGGRVAPLSCLVQAAAPYVEKLRGPAIELVKSLVGVVRGVYKDTIEPALEGLVGKGLDKLLTTLLGAEGRDRVQEVFAKAMDFSGWVAGATAKLAAFSAALEGGSAAELKNAWNDARAHLVQSKPGFGAKDFVEAGRVFLRWAADRLVDKLGPEVLHWVVQGLGSGLTLVNRVVDGVCGLIPEIGAGICTVVISGLLRLGYDLVASEVVRELALLGAKKLVGLAIDKLAEALAPRVTAIVEKAAASKGTLSGFAALLRPLLDFVERSLEEWVQPGSQQMFAFRDAVVELGDVLTEKAVAKLAAGGNLVASAPPPSLAPAAAPCEGAQPVLSEDGASRNLALGRGAVATASSTIAGYEQIHRVEHLNDGWYGNCRSWVAASMPAWVEIDLGREYSVQKVVLGAENTGRYSDRGATSLEIVVRGADGKSVTVASYDDARAPLRRATPFVLKAPVVGRYVRVNLKGSDGADVRIDELEVWGTDTARGR
jgi:hypothetical protein